jgi:hypothetical protein
MNVSRGRSLQQKLHCCWLLTVCSVPSEMQRAGA